MEYYLGTANPSFVGAEYNFKFKAVNYEEAWDIAASAGIEYIEGVEDVVAYEEENDICYEYDYTCKEVSKKEYEDSESEEIEL